MQLAISYKHTAMKVNAISYILAKWVKSVIWEAIAMDVLKVEGL